MKKVIRLTESDLTRIVKRVINEQNTKCPNKKVTKQIVDSKLPMLQKKINGFLSKDIDKLIKNFDEKYQSLIKSNVLKHKNLITKINQNQLYSKFGIIQKYNPTSDATIILNDLYKLLLEKVEGNFFNKQLVKLYVNKDNVKEVKQEISDVIDGMFSAVYRSIFFPSRIVGRGIESIYPDCPNGESSVITYETLNPETDLLKKNMINTIHKKINSYL